MVHRGVAVFVIELVDVCVSYSGGHYVRTLTISLQLRARVCRSRKWQTGGASGPKTFDRYALGQRLGAK